MKYDPSELNVQAAAFHGTGVKVRVRFKDGSVRVGTVGKTTGWRPSYLLMRKRTDVGSSCLITLDADVSRA